MSQKRLQPSQVDLALSDLSNVNASPTDGDVLTFDNNTFSWIAAEPTGGGGDGTWGSITGTLADQTDLQSALDNKADTSSLATVAISGDYDDLTDKPTLGTAASQNSTAFATAAQGTAADISVQPGDKSPLARCRTRGPVRAMVRYRSRCGVRSMERS